MKLGGKLLILLTLWLHFIWAELELFSLNEHSRIINEIKLNCPLKPGIIKKDFGYNSFIVFTSGHIYFLYKRTSIWIFDKQGNYQTHFSIFSLPYTNKYMVLNIFPVIGEDAIGFPDAYPRYCELSINGTLENIFYIPPDIIPLWIIKYKNNLFCGEIHYRISKNPVLYKINMLTSDIETLLYIPNNIAEFWLKTNGYIFPYFYLDINPRKKLIAASTITFPDIWVINYETGKIINHNTTAPPMYKQYDDTVDVSTLQGIINDWMATWSACGPIYWLDDSTIVRVRGHLKDTFYVDIYSADGEFKHTLYSEDPLIFARDGILYTVKDITDHAIIIEKRRLR